MNNYWHVAALVWIGIAVLTFLYLYFRKVAAPFGRHSREDWGPMISNTLGWILMELPSPICLLVAFFALRSPETPTIAYLPLALWTAHYLHRSLIYPFRMRGGQKKMPVVITFSAIFFNLVNGTMNGVFLARGWFVQSDALIVAGLVLFAAGMYINLRSDTMLINLRKPGETGYKIPRGFLFDKVTAPNLFGEIVEWTGFVLMAPSLASAGFLAWTLANLVPRARDHHQWYLRKFPDYPKARKVLIPGVW